MRMKVVCNQQPFVQHGALIASPLWSRLPSKPPLPGNNPSEALALSDLHTSEAEFLTKDLSYGDPLFADKPLNPKFGNIHPLNI